MEVSTTRRISKGIQTLVILTFMYGYHFLNLSATMVALFDFNPFQYFQKNLGNSEAEKVIEHPDIPRQSAIPDKLEKPNIKIPDIAKDIYTIDSVQNPVYEITITITDEILDSTKIANYPEPLNKMFLEEIFHNLESTSGVEKCLGLNQLFHYIITNKEVALFKDFDYFAYQNVLLLKSKSNRRLLCPDVRKLIKLLKNRRYNEYGELKAQICTYIENNIYLPPVFPNSDCEILDKI